MGFYGPSISFMSYPARSVIQTIPYLGPFFMLKSAEYEIYFVHKLLIKRERERERERGREREREREREIL